MADIVTKNHAPIATAGDHLGSQRVSWWILLGLVGGLLAGVLIESSGSPALQRASDLVEPIGTLWVNAIRMTVIPLLISLVITAVAGADAGGATRVGGHSMVLFVAMVALSMLFALLTAPIVLLPLQLDASTTASLRASVAVPPSATQPLSFADWLVSIIPSNPIQAAAEGAVLPVIVFSVLFGLAACRIGAIERESIIGFFVGVRDALFVLIRWILIVAPIGVFALVLPLAARLGSAAAGAIGFFIVSTSALLAVGTGLLYLVVAVWGRMPLGEFARACAPVQAVAISTRSSLASMPALLESARTLGLPARIAAVTIPLGVSVFKYGSPIARITGTLFVAKLYGIELGAVELTVLAVALIILPFYSPGVPSGGLLVMTPVYLALNLPVEGIGLLIAVDAIPDMFLTVANVTAVLTSATLLSRAVRAASEAPPRAVEHAGPR
jgi:Na+/H+-dicarboxylate symporter